MTHVFDMYSAQLGDICDGCALVFKPKELKFFYYGDLNTYCPKCLDGLLDIFDARNCWINSGFHADWQNRNTFF